MSSTSSRPTPSASGSSVIPSATASSAGSGMASSPSITFVGSDGPRPSWPPGPSGPPGPPCGDPQGCNAPPPAALYLYTFVSTLIILLLVSGGIIARSLVLRRRQQIAIANGTWVPPSRLRESPYSTQPKPKIFDAYVVEGGTGAEERWCTMKPFSVSDVAPAAKMPAPQPEPPSHPTPAIRSLLQNPFRPPPTPPPPTVEPSPVPPISDPVEVRVALLIAMPSQAQTDTEAPPYLEFGVLDVEVVASGKMSSQSDEGRVERRDYLAMKV